MKLSDIINNYLSHNKSFFKELKEKRIINEKKDINFFNLSKIVHDEMEPVFVLSTGRAGTMLLTKILEKLEDVIAVHEPEPELSYGSKLAYENWQSNSALIEGMFEGARYEMLRSSFLLNKKFIETNNRITFFAHQIAKLYPKSKFIHLVRQPNSFIISGLNRQWYTGQNLYDEARIISNKNSFWENLNQTEKIAWLWNETNQFIEDFKLTIEPDRILTVKAESFFTNIEESQNILKFIQLNKIGENTLKSIISNKVNSKKSTIIIDNQSLTKVIETHCPLLKKYY